MTCCQALPTIVPGRLPNRARIGSRRSSSGRSVSSVTAVRFRAPQGGLARRHPPAARGRLTPPLQQSRASVAAGYRAQGYLNLRREGDQHCARSGDRSVSSTCRRASTTSSIVPPVPEAHQRLQAPRERYFELLAQPQHGVRHAGERSSSRLSLVSIVAASRVSPRRGALRDTAASVRAPQRSPRLRGGLAATPSSRSRCELLDTRRREVDLVMTSGICAPNNSANARRRREVSRRGLPARRKPESPAVLAGVDRGDTQLL
jgi:hypothetical protein